MSDSTPQDPRCVLAPDVRTAEAHLLELVEGWSPRGAPLAQPVRIVVPSQSLRRHLQARLLERRPAWLGVEIATLHHVAGAILAAAGEAPPKGGALFETLLARAAKRDRTLAVAFGDFADGWSALAAPARDLVDAGFAPELAEALLERIDAERGALPARALARARALVVVLAEALRALHGLGLAPDSARYARAAELLVLHGPALLPARAVAIHGFADATGVATDLIAALVRHAGAHALLVDARLDPAEPAFFGMRLRERLESAVGAAVRLTVTAPAPSLSTFDAETFSLQARAVAAAARAALDSGVKPERIAIVARDLGQRRSALARELDRQAVPFSASSASGPPSAHAHAARALGRLLERGRATPVELVLELLREAPDLPPVERPGVRLALRAAGVARLGDLGRLSRGAIENHRAKGFPLPVRAGSEIDERGELRTPHRRQPVEPLLAALARLQRALAAAERWPESATWPEHARALATLAAALDDARAPVWRSLLGAARALEAELPADLPLVRREAFELLARAWRELEREPWGGAGAGVQLLSVTEARGLTFDRLIVAGLERGAFPRTVVEEPVLADRLRARLRDLLPDLPVKAEGHDEERFLFAGLLGAAPDVVLGRSNQDDDGRALPPSPLLGALARRRDLPGAPFTGQPSPAALDRAIAAALAGRERGLTPHLAPAIEEGRRRFAPAAVASSVEVARARLAIVAELDSDPSTEEGRLRISELGPYFGFVGTTAGLGGAVAATTLERHADCGWQAFLERALRLEPLADPLADLPGVDVRLVGAATHAALAELFGAEGERALATRLAAPGTPLHWPDDERLSAAIARAVERTARDNALHDPAVQRLLAAQVRLRLAIARDEDFRLGASSLVGAELEGELALAGGERVAFRADRVHREGDRLVFVDWKVGDVPDKLDVKKAEVRTKNLLAKIASGTSLQAAIYATAVENEASEARYVYLGDEPRFGRTVTAQPDDELRGALTRSLSTLAEARRRGLYPPRLLDSKLAESHRGCAWCRVVEACVQHDSSFRTRLERWHERNDETTARSESDEALWRLWRLPAGEGGE